MKRILSLALALLLALTAVASTTAALLSVGAADTSEPVFILDFTKEETLSLISTISFHTDVHEGEYTKLTAAWSDPQATVMIPEGSKPREFAYTLAVYRTTAQRKGEMFAARSDIPTMGQAGTHVQWSWASSGEWETLLIENTAWATAAEDVTFSALRFDPLESQVVNGETIDFQFIAFFATREEAEAFDFEAYKAMTDVPPETEAPTEAVTRPAPDEPYDWPTPDYTEAETSRLDNYDGTLKYETSEDGSTVTISYQVNGETVTYTVPNQKNYLFGGYAAVDDLGRPLYNSGEVGAYNAEDRRIGLFYFLWHNEDSDRGLYDLQKILDELGPVGAADLNNGRYGSLGVSHWFAEPLYGYYYINDEWILRKHVELLTNAGVDFLFFDTTNGEAYLPSAIKLMSILHEYNEMGYDAPQVVFYTNTNSAATAAEIQRVIYRENLYPDTWYMVNNRPVIVTPEAYTNNRFTIMTTQWPNDEVKRTNAWPWMDFEWPQRIYETIRAEPFAVNVSIAQHSGTVCFSDSSLKGNYTNRGRSFVNPNNIPSTDPAFDSVLKAAYDAWVADPSLSNQGLNFQAQWDHALASEAPTILVTGWNEWIAGNWGCFVDTASVEFSRDAEMTRGYYFDNYYMQMTANIQKAKGTAPVVVQDARKAINITGSFDQWNDIPVTYTDGAGDTIDRDHDGFGNTHYYNFTGRNDIVEAKMTADTKNIYFYVKTAEAITKYDTESSWMQLYLNADRETTGWYGYDFIINAKAKGDFTTTVAKYSGTDGAYGFTECGEVSYRVEGNEMMIAVPLELLGIEGYLEINAEFKWADSRSVYDEMEDFYCDGDVAPLGRMNYVFQNYIPGVSQITYPDPNETVAETVTDAAGPAETGDSGTNAPETEAPAKGGCASLVASIALLPVMLCGIALLKKKERV